MRKVLLSFYTEGHPYDLGKNLINQKDAFLEIGKKYFDEVIIFCPRELKKLDPNWNNILYDESYFRKHLEASKKYKINLAWAKLNGLLWKPKLIHMILNQDSIKSEDIVVYHDIDLFKYKSYTKNIKKLSRVVEKKLKNKSFYLAQGVGLISQQIKYELLIKYLGINGNYHNDFSGHTIAFKKNNLSKDFFNSWLELTTIEFNRSQITNFPNKKDFIWHTQEQACLTILVYKWLMTKRKKSLARFFHYNRKNILDCEFVEILEFIKIKILFFFKINPIIFFKERFLVKTF